MTGEKLVDSIKVSGEERFFCASAVSNELLEELKEEIGGGGEAKEASHISRVGAVPSLNGENRNFRITPWRGNTFHLQQWDPTAEPDPGAEEPGNWVEFGMLLPANGASTGQGPLLQLLGWDNDSNAFSFSPVLVEEGASGWVTGGEVYRFVKSEIPTAGTDLVVEDGAMKVNTSGTATGQRAFVIGGNGNEASGNQSFAGGLYARAKGEESFAFGNDVVAGGRYSEAHGYKQKAVSKSELDENGTLDGNSSGYITKDIKVKWADIQVDAESINGSYQAGEGAVVSGAKHVVFGSRSEASGNTNLVTGRDSKASNSNNEVYGNYAHAEGRGNQCWGNAQSVSGKYCDPKREEGVGDNSPYLEIVGNGSSASARSNARTLDKLGNERIAGEVYPNGGNKSYSELIAEAAGAVTVETIEL